MRVDRVSYQKIFPTGMAYLNHKIGVEIQVDENDNWQECFELAKRMVEQWNLESNPGMAAAMEYMSLTGMQVKYPIEPAPSKDEKVEGMKQLLQLCTTKQLLERQRGQVERLNNPEVNELFQSKLKSFQ